MPEKAVQLFFLFSIKHPHSCDSITPDYSYPLFLQSCKTMDSEIHIQKQDSHSLWVNSLFLGLFSLVTALFCMALIRINGQLSPIWFATALMTIVVFRTPPRHWPVLLGSCFIGLVVADIFMLGDGLLAQLYPLLNLSEAIVGGILLRTIFRRNAPLNTLANWAIFILVSGVFTPFIAAILSCALLNIPQQSLSHLFSTWVVSETTGMMALGPVALLWQRKALLNHRLILETVATLLGTLLCCGAILYSLPWPFAFVIVILFYSAVRLPRLAAFIIYFATVAMISLMQAFGLIPQYDTPLSWFFSAPCLPLLLILVPSHIMTLVMYSFRQEKQHIVESEIRFRHAMEYSAVGMALISPDGRWLQVNTSLCDLLGYRPGELTQMTVQQISHPDDLHIHLSQKTELLLGNISSYRMEKRYLHQDGHIVWTMLTISLVRDSKHLPLYFIAQIQDITDIKQLTEALYQEKERMLITLDAIDEAVISTDEKMRIIFMNPVAEQITGWIQHHAEGRLITDILHITRNGEEITLNCAHSKHAGTVTTDEELILHNRAGEQFAINYSLSPLSTAEGHNIGCVVVIQDIRESREIFKHLRYSASHDMLTHLPNRAGFEQQLKQLVQNQTTAHHVLAFIDLDHFKAVNDNAGHAAGDKLLQELSDVMSQQLRHHDFLARIGGDEFALLLPECSLHDATDITLRLIQAISQYRLSWQGQDYVVSSSIGLTSFYQHDNPTDIMAQADIACYQAKKNGRNQIICWQENKENIAF